MEKIKDFFATTIGIFIFILAFVSPIFSILWGDKTDVALSFMIPFWGVFVAIGHFT